MAEDTLRYAAGFGALAFLKPKHLDMSDLARWVDEEELKQLKPSPEAVRDAIAACKQVGLRARFGRGIALSIAGDAAALKQCFGVCLVVEEEASGKTSAWFEDESGKKMDLVTPLQGHPLADHIVNIVIDRGIEFNRVQRKPPPKFPTKTAPWEKQFSYHIWPHELHDRMATNSRNLPHAAVQRVKDDVRAGGYKFSVSLVDSGLDGNHTYLRYPGRLRRASPTNPQDPEYALHWPEVASLEWANAALLQRALVVHEEVLAAHSAAQQLLESLEIPSNSHPRVGGRFVAMEGNEAVLKQDAFDDRDDRLRSAAVQIVESQIWRDYRAVGSASARELHVLLELLRRQRTGLIWSGTGGVDAYNAAIFRWLNEFNTYINAKRRRLLAALRWVRTHGERNYDHDGHGTGMAASILGVSGKAHIASFPALTNSARQEYLQVIGEPPVSLEWIFKEAATYSSEQMEPLIEKRKNPDTLAPDEIVEYRIMSNSYSIALRIANDGAISAGDMQYLGQWRALISDLCKVQHYSILFSAGNSGNPATPDISHLALLGQQGAIIVGGAYDYGQNANRIVLLSNAAHGVEIPLPYPTGGEKPPVNAAPIVIPDICGFVGPESSGESPYVYLPYRNDTWFYLGGGTSSACAQLAGLCGALRARWINLTPQQVKDAVKQGGDPMIAPRPQDVHGRSYQGFTPAQLNNVRLANILGAFAEAAQMMGDTL